MKATVKTEAAPEGTEETLLEQTDGGDAGRALVPVAAGQELTPSPNGTAPDAGHKTP